MKCYWTSQYICIQPTQASQVIGVWGRLHGGPVSIRFLSVRTLDTAFILCGAHRVVESVV